MLKKLKHNFILIFMTISLLTLTGVLLFVGLSTKNRLEQDCRSVLSNYLSNSQSPPGKINNSSIILVLKYTPSGDRIDNIKNDETFPYTDGEINEISKYCITSKKYYGKIPDYSLVFMKRETQLETTYAFYDVSGNEQTLQQLCLSFIVGGIIASVILYIISIFLSRWCIRPIEETWKKQQDFIADASHELKTPLTVILANAAILNERANSSIQSQEKCVHYIEDEAKHMSRLVNDMLFLAKTDALRDNSQMSILNFSELFMNCYLPFESIAFEKHISMNADVSPDIELSGSTDKLTQLVNILLDNACKYTIDNGQITIQLTKKGTTASLLMRNTSDPIAKDQLSHLFERFYRIDEARTRSNGYGLGLSIAYSIVQMHHGKIRMDYSNACGTTVVVEIPCIHS